jgi:hypothetical protein
LVIAGITWGIIKLSGRSPLPATITIPSARPSIPSAIPTEVLPTQGIMNSPTNTATQIPTGIIQQPRLAYFQYTTEGVYGGIKIYAFDPNTDQFNIILQDPSVEFDASSWSPDRTRVIYTTGNNYSDIFLYDLGLKATRNITNNPDRYDNEIDWSPDQDELLMIGQSGSNRGLNDGTTSIYKINVITGDRQRVFYYHDYWAFACLSFTPSGEKVTFLWSGDFWIIKPGDEQPVNMTKNGVIGECGAHSPVTDGLFAYIARPDIGQPSDVFITQISDGSTRQLTFGLVPVGSYSGGLSWSPDGTSLLVWVDDHMVVIDSDSGAITPLSTPGLSNLGWYQPWSPDSQTIAFLGNNEVYTIGRDGSNIRQWTHDREYKSGLVWFNP